MTVHVGMKSNRNYCKFEVPCDVLVPRSTHAFRAERLGNEIELRAYSKEAFSTYLQLVYTNQIVVTEMGAKEDLNEIGRRLVGLYLVAVKMEDAESVNRATDEIWKILRTNGMNEVLTSLAFTRVGMLKVRQMLIDYIVESEDDSSRFAEWLYGERDSNYLDKQERQRILSKVIKEFMRRRGEGRAPGGGSKAGASRYHIQEWRLTQDGKTVKPEGMEDPY